jgi:hypothetical protein
MAIDPISALSAGAAAIASMHQRGTAPRDIEAAAVRRQNRNDPANSVERSNIATPGANNVDSSARTGQRVSGRQGWQNNGQAPVTEADINRADVDASGEEFRAIKLINASVPQQPEETEQIGTTQTQENAVESAAGQLNQAAQGQENIVEAAAGQVDQEQTLAERIAAGRQEIDAAADQEQTLAERIAVGRQEIDAAIATEQTADSPEDTEVTGNLEQAQNNGNVLTANQQEAITERLTESATVQTSADIAERNAALTPAQEQGIKAYEHVQNYSSDPLSLSNAASAA